MTLNHFDLRLLNKQINKSKISLISSRLVDRKSKKIRDREYLLYYLYSHFGLMHSQNI